MPTNGTPRGAPILCLDFDGVCHSYTSGWINAWTITDLPVPGLFEFLEAALKQFRVAIYSSRSEFATGRLAMRDWMAGFAVAYYADDPNKIMRATWLMDQIEFPASKPSAFVTLDDRAITFKGAWPDVGMLRGFVTWNEHLKRRPNSEKAANPVEN